MYLKSLFNFKCLVLVAFFLMPLTSNGQEDEPIEPSAMDSRSFLEDHAFRAGLKLGASFDPGRFMIIGHGEYALERYFTLGPMIQIGIGNDQNLWSPTIGGRFRAPLYDLKRVELSLHSGAGFIGRTALGSTFYSFNFVAGADVEMFLIPELSCGLGVILNVTSSAAERTITVIHAGLTYHL